LILSLEIDFLIFFKLIEIKIENVLPLNPTTIKEPSFIKKTLSSKLNDNSLEESDAKPKNQHIQEQLTHHKNNPVVIGPNDELIPIGISGIFDENEKEKNEKRDEIVYRLYEDGLPPYLYFTNKLDTNGFMSYEEMNAHYNGSKKLNAHSRKKKLNKLKHFYI